MNDFMLGAAVRVQAELSSYGGGTVTEATPPRIVGSVRDGVKKFTGYLTSNANLKLALIVLGGCIIFICVGLLAARKWWPNTPIGRPMQDQGGGKVVWCLAAIVLGVVFIAPDQVAPFIAAIPAYLAQIVMDIIDKIFNFSTAA